MSLHLGHKPSTADRQHISRVALPPALFIPQPSGQASQLVRWPRAARNATRTRRRAALSSLRRRGRRCDAACGGASAAEDIGVRRGRTALGEVMRIDEDLRRAVLAGESVGSLRARARAAGMRTLRESGLDAVLAGITTIDEVIRETAATL